MAENKLTLRAGDEVVVRMYGQGFGDCFLLAFPRSDAEGQLDYDNPVYVLIDCGVFYRTPQDKERMCKVTGSVRKATGGEIDLLVVTHEHHDHLCGFEYAKDEWKQIQVHNIWVAWTENVEHPATKRFDHEQETLERLVLEVHQIIARQLDDNRALDLELEHPLRPELEHLRALLGFSLGEGLEGPLDRLSKLPNLVLSDIVNNPEKRFRINPATHTRSYCEPMDVRAVPGTLIDAYVLGSPTDPDRFSLTMDESEVYPKELKEDPTPASAASRERQREREQIALEAVRADRLAVSAAVARHIGVVNEDEYAPFRPSEGIDLEEATKDKFFQERYFTSTLARRIDGEWLRGTSRFALQLDEFTNNSSLALAFRLPNERYLLFVGDAQVGNWLSWQDFRPTGWKRTDDQRSAIAARPTIEELLEKTIVYKVGHHGSHNATLKQNGLEKMPDDLVAFVPVAHSYPQEDNKWTIPLPSLMRKLRDKTGGQVVVPYNTEYTSAAFNRRIEHSNEDLPAMTRTYDDDSTKSYGGPVPLWKQVRIAT